MFTTGIYLSDADVAVKSRQLICRAQQELDLGCVEQVHPDESIQNQNACADKYNAFVWPDHQSLGRGFAYCAAFESWLLNAVAEDLECTVLMPPTPLVIRLWQWGRDKNALITGSAIPDYLANGARPGDLYLRNRANEGEHPDFVPIPNSILSQHIGHCGFLWELVSDGIRTVAANGIYKPGGGSKAVHLEHYDSSIVENPDWGFGFIPLNAVLGDCGRTTVTVACEVPDDSSDDSCPVDIPLGWERNESGSADNTDYVYSDDLCFRQRKPEILQDDEEPPVIDENTECSAVVPFGFEVNASRSADDRHNYLYTRDLCFRRAKKTLNPGNPFEKPPVISTDTPPVVSTGTPPVISTGTPPVVSTGTPPAKAYQEDDSECCDATTQSQNVTVNNYIELPRDNDVPAMPPIETEQCPDGHRWNGEFCEPIEDMRYIDAFCAGCQVPPTPQVVVVPQSGSSQGQSLPSEIKLVMPDVPLTVHHIIEDRTNGNDSGSQKGSDIAATMSPTINVVVPEQQPPVVNVHNTVEAPNVVIPEREVVVNAPVDASVVIPEREVVVNAPVDASVVIPEREVVVNAPVDASVVIPEREVVVNAPVNVEPSDVTVHVPENTVNLQTTVEAPNVVIPEREVVVNAPPINFTNGDVNVSVPVSTPVDVHPDINVNIENPHDPPSRDPPFFDSCDDYDDDCGCENEFEIVLGDYL